jgi:hypothetical protein
VPESSDAINDSAHVIGVRQHFGNETRDLKSSGRSHSVGNNSRYDTIVRCEIVLRDEDIVRSLLSMSDVKEVKGKQLVWRISVSVCAIGLGTVPPVEVLKHWMQEFTNEAKSLRMPVQCTNPFIACSVVVIPR